MSDGRLPFVSVGVCKDLVDAESVVVRIEQVYRWLGEGAVLHADPAAMRMACDEPTFKSHAKAVILPPLGVAGVRVVGYHIQDDGSGPSSPDSTRLVMLMDLASGKPLAIVDEHYNYTLRTAASVAVAAKYLCPEEPILGLIGAGGVAEATLRIFAEIIPLQAVLVTSRREKSRYDLAERFRSQMPFPIDTTPDVAEIVGRCNVVVTATTTKTPLISADTVRPGMLLCALGSHELEPGIYGSADKVFVDDWSQTERAHDIVPLLENGQFGRDRLSGELADVVLGRIAGRESPNDVIVVRTEGMASQDIALAHWVYLEAERQGRLQMISL